ncbi:MAG: type II toxin-antitoxin system VapC family toxin [Proteobacteria bacterium]|nr:type II toxin-antitoxin system VapC family toxin [Pseudomonadota bacterium]
MALQYLLDTNIISDLMRSPAGEIGRRIAEVGEDSICTSIIVAAELRFGAAKSASKALVERVELVLSAIDTLPLEPPADRHYAVIRHALSLQGVLIGPNDLLIAAHALALELTVVTANEREFGRVPGLKVENWLTSPPVTDQ